MIRLSSTVTVFGLLAAGLGLSGCMSSPTYGTGTTANQQLMDDVTSFGNFMPKQGPAINYKPRPPLVGTTADENKLPPPQKDIANAANPAWPESPEQKRQRLRDEATKNQNNPFYEPQVATDAGGGPYESPEFNVNQRRYFGPQPGTTATSAQQSADFKRRLAENKQGSPTVRKYLSEPPVSYREPASTAPSGQLGEDEWKKQKQREAAATGKKKGTVLGRLFSWL